MIFIGIILPAEPSDSKNFSTTIWPTTTAWAAFQVSYAIEK
jgi:hypothetical protein